MDVHPRESDQDYSSGKRSWMRSSMISSTESWPSTCANASYQLDLDGLDGAMEQAMERFRLIGQRFVGFRLTSLRREGCAVLCASLCVCGTNGGKGFRLRFGADTARHSWANEHISSCAWSSPVLWRVHRLGKRGILEDGNAAPHTAGRLVGYPVRRPTTRSGGRFVSP